MNPLWRGRLIVATAAVLWSMSGLFIMLLTRPPAWLGDVKPVAAEQIACWRCLLGAGILLVILRSDMVRWHRLLPVMAICFAVMNGLFVAAMSLGDVAEASLLQYTAPLWVFLINVWLLRKTQASRLDVLALVIAMTGIVVIVIGRLQVEQAKAAILALGAGAAFAGVLLCMDFLQHFASRWLAFVNLLAAGLITLPWAWDTPWPQGVQWLILIVFALVQTALPNLLMPLAMRTVPAHEAAMITLLDPLLAPWWAWLVTHNAPSTTTLMGGAVFLLALVLRYAWPEKGRPSVTA